MRVSRGHPPASTHPAPRRTSRNPISVALVAILTTAVVSCGGGGGSAPALAVPDLADSAGPTLVAGQRAEAIVFTNSGGGSLTKCAVSPVLPSGLMVSHTDNNASCQITGMPMVVSASRAYTVTATNATGSDPTPATVSITVSGPAAVPILTGIFVAPGNVSATISLTSDAAGTAHILLLSPHDAGDSLTAAQVVARASASQTASGDFVATKEVSANTTDAVIVSGLTASTDYSAYIVVQDDDENNSAVDGSLDFTTLATADTTAPMITGTAVTNVLSTSATLGFTSDDAGIVAVVVLPDADSPPANAAAVKSPGAGAITATGAAPAASAATIALTGLARGTAYKAHFVVTNGSGTESAVTSTDTFTTTANNAPMADAGPDQSVAHDAAVTLDGSGSSDADAADTLTYAWTQTAGTAVSLSSATAQMPTFDAAPADDAGEALSFQLEVSDGAESDTDTVTVTVAAVPVGRLTGVAAADIEAHAANISLTSAAAGTAYVAVFAVGADQPSAAAIKAATSGQGGVIAAANAPATANTQATVPLTGLRSSTTYDAFVVVETADGFSAVVKVEIRTVAGFELIESTEAYAFIAGRTYNADLGVGKSANGALLKLKDVSEEEISTCTLVTVDGNDVDVSNPARSLPEGITLRIVSAKIGCSFDGMPTSYTPLRMYGVMATEKGSTPRTSIAEIPIKVATREEPDFDIPHLIFIETGTDYTESPHIFTNRGGFVETCVDVVAEGADGLPSGLSIAPTAHKLSCQIVGETSQEVSSSRGLATPYAFNTSIAKEADARVAANYYIVAPAGAERLAVAAVDTDSERLRTFLTASSFHYLVKAGGHFDFAYVSTAVVFNAGTVTRCRLADDSPPLPRPFAVAPGSVGAACVVAPTAEHTTMAPWEDLVTNDDATLFGPTDFTIIGSSSEGESAPITLRLEAKVGTFMAPSLSQPTFPADGTAGALVIPKGTNEITPIPLPNSGSKVSATWHQSCSTSGMPAGLSLRTATAADATAYNTANPSSPIEEGGTCVIVGTPDTATASPASIEVSYRTNSGAGFNTSDSVTFTISVEAPGGN